MLCPKDPPLPHDLAPGNRDLRDEPFPLYPIEIFVFNGCHPSREVKTFDELGRWVSVRRTVAEGGLEEGPGPRGVPVVAYSSR